VWQRVVCAEDPPIDVNRAAFAPTELSRLLNGYDICIETTRTCRALVE
jgi:hypothetical protein